MMSKLTYITNIKTPYKTEQLSVWADVLSPATTLDVWYLSQEKGLNLWNDFSSIKSHYTERIIEGRNRCATLLSLIRRGPELRGSILLIGGYYGPEYWLALLLGRIFAHRVALVFDGIDPTKIAQQKGWRYHLKSRFARSCHAVLGNGTVSRRFFTEALGVPPERIYDQVLFANPAAAKVPSPLPESRTARLRVDHAIPPSSKVVGFCGRLIQRKRVDTLIDAVARSRHRPVLVVIGDGPEREALQSRADAAGIQSRFLGGIGERAELFETLGMLDLLVLPSEDEPWGMVVNEAAAMGTNVLASDSCGVGPELAHAPFGGVFPAGNVEALAYAMDGLLDRRTDRAAVVEASMRFNSPSRSASEIRRLVSEQGIRSPRSNKSSPDKILNIMQCTNLCGMEQSTLHLMNTLNPKYSACVLSVHPFGDLKLLLDKEGILSEDCDYRGPMGLLSHLRLRRKIRRIGLDRPILMTGPTLSGILALPTKRCQPRILMVHHYHKDVHPAWTWKLLYRLALSRFDLITYPSDFVREEAIALCPALAKRSLTLQNVVEKDAIITDEDRREAKARFGLDRNSIVIGNAGWLVENKRFDIFLEVAATLERNGVHSLNFLVAGDGSQRTALEARSAQLGISQKVTFLGWVDDMRQFYAALDIMLFNTDWDAYPTSPIEAMSHGIPVVASALHSGLGEILVDGCGFLWPTHDIEAMSRQIGILARDSDLRAEIGIHARQRVEEMTSEQLTLTPLLEALR